MTIDYDKILRMFCLSHDIGRFSLTDPFRKDGWTCATDGHIACLIPQSVFTRLDYTDKQVPNAPYLLSAAQRLEKPMTINASLFADPLRYDFVQFWLKLAEVEEFYWQNELDTLDIDNEFAPDPSGPPFPAKLINVNFANKAAFDARYLHIISKACQMAGFNKLKIAALSEDSSMVCEAGEWRFVLMPLRTTPEDRAKMPKVGDYERKAKAALKTLQKSKNASGPLVSRATGE